MSLTVDEQKKRLRKRFLSARNTMSSNELYSKSRFITSKLINTEDYLKADVVHCYVSMIRKNEVETRNLIQHMLDHGKKVVVPKMEKMGQLSHYEIKGLDELTENKWGVAEPVKNSTLSVNKSSLELVIVPMVSGDKYKNRLGYGKGFYDRFLEGLHATKIGFLFDLQMYEERLPTDKFDVQLDMLITESKIVT
jgi:5-formyltetrahydrofolate cyclo-ligase